MVEMNTLLLIGLGIAAAAVTAWWMRNRGASIKRIADAIEDKIEDATGLDVELDSVVEDVVAAAEDVVGDTHDATRESLEAGDSLSEVADAASDAAAESLQEKVAAVKKLNKDDLMARAEELGLDTSGKKAALIQRITEFYESHQ
jgi:ABC-type glycerol-3-phosphate transport system substrate-binding protein|tara:strand:+ start:176 stop:610 length:435 start_codon:yes stop_codon:yes gene_type:complete